MTITNNHHQQTSSPTAPLYPELINDEPEYSVYSPPTATAVYDTSFRHGQDANINNSNKLVISIPPSSVLLDEPYASSSNNSHQNYQSNSTTTTSPPAYQPYSAAQHHQSTTPTAATAAAVTPQHQQVGRAYRYINGRTVKPKNAHLPDEVLIFKEKRKSRTATAAVTGGVIGLFLFPVLGPLGPLVGASGAYAVAKTVGKRRERKLIRECMAHPQHGQQAPMSFSAAAATLPTASAVATPVVFTSAVPVERPVVVTSAVPIERAEAA